VEDFDKLALSSILFIMMTSHPQRRHPFSLDNAIAVVTLAKSSSDSMAIPGLAAVLAVTLCILETTQVDKYCMHIAH
jgi:hypothetical protein